MNKLDTLQHLLEPEEYFLVLKRHELLRRLQLMPTPSEAAGSSAPRPHSHHDDEPSLRPAVRSAG